MATIKKGKDETYTVRYDAGVRGDGSRIQKSKGGFVKKADAEKYLNQMLNGVYTNTYIEPSKMFLYEYLNKWLEGEKARLSPPTYAGYEVNIRCHTNEYIGGIRLQDLKPTHIKDLYSKLAKEGKLTRYKDEDKKYQIRKSELSPKSIMYVHRVLSKALEDAVKDEIIFRNPARLVTPPKVPKHKADFLTTEQIKDMLEKFKNDDMYMIVYLTVVLGLRRGEVLGLRWGNIDIKNNIVSICEEITTVKGKAIKLDDVKTEGSNRDLIVTDRMIRELKNHKRLQSERKLKLGKDYHTSDYVCTRYDGTLFPPNYITVYFPIKMQQFGLPCIKFHSLRHSNGALMVAENIHIKGASERLGHSTIAITNDIYGHVEKKIKQQIAQQIDDAIYGE